jgi:predicted N-formylglutamate amidohydrolase
VVLQGVAEGTVRPSGIDSVAVENAEGAGAYVILCDHASNRFPPEFGDLGLVAEDREAHIAWDPGALGVSRHLSELLDAPLAYPTVSRLIVDCNRSLDAPNLIAALSERTIVPGNARLTDTERRRRIAAVHEPYHRAIEALVASRLAAGRETALVAVHSFTPVYHGIARPWQVGILFDRDRRLADRLIADLAADGLTVGANEPYSPADGVYYTLSRHAESRGLACVMIEIRNDLLIGAAEQRAWAARLAAALGGVGA